MYINLLKNEVIFATEKDLAAIKALADAHRHEIGFVNRATLAEAIAHREI